MTGPLIFLILMVFLIVAARRETRWAQRQAELAAARRLIADFNAAWPAIRESVERMTIAMRDFATITELAAWNIRRANQRSSDLQYAFYRNVTAVTPKTQDGDTLSRTIGDHHEDVPQNRC